MLRQCLTVYLIIGSISFICLTACQSQQSDEWSTFESEDFLVSYPAQMETDIQSPDAALFIYLEKGNSRSRFRDNINIIRQDLRGTNIDLNAFVAISEQQLRAAGKLLESRRLRQQSQEYHQVVFEQAHDGKKYKFLQHYWVIPDQTACILTMTCEADDFDKHQNTGQQIFETFKLR